MTKTQPPPLYIRCTECKKVTKLWISVNSTDNAPLQAMCSRCASRLEIEHIIEAFRYMLAGAWTTEKLNKLEYLQEILANIKTRPEESDDELLARILREH